MKCRNCNHKNFTLITKIGNQPISSYFPQKKIKLKSYSLNLYKCKFCNLIQLNKVPGLKFMYGSQYGYKTGISNLMIKHLKKKFDWIKKNKNRKNDNKYS